MKGYLEIIASILLGSATLISCAANNQYPARRLNILNIGDSMPHYGALYPCGKEEVDSYRLDKNNKPKEKLLRRKYCNEEDAIKEKFYPIIKGIIGREPISITKSKTLDGDRVWYTDGILNKPDGKIDMVVIEYKKTK